MARGDGWPVHLPIGATRVARPTDRLAEVRAFYGEVLGLPELGAFEAHAGYSGVFFGLPDERHQLEFTTHDQGSPCPAPSRDNLLVLYFEDGAAVERLVERLTERGHPAVAPENPYWETVVSSVTVEDPDGWRVVLVASTPATRESE